MKSATLLFQRNVFQIYFPLRRYLQVGMVMFLLFSFSMETLAQEKCLSAIIRDKQNEANPELKRKREVLERQIQNYIKANPYARAGAQVNIPVVFQVVHNGDAPGTGENLSDALLLAQLGQLNADFARMNTDAGNTPAVFQGVAANTMIQFCLATVDPDMQATTGIIRHNLALDQNACWNSTFISNNIVNARSWDTEKYLNIFTVQKINNDECDSDGILGYATFPIGTSFADDVAVHRASTIGSLAMPNPVPGSYGMGRTVTHEVGHWLMLEHIWFNAGCVTDDGVADTPLQDADNGGCPTHPSPSCANAGDMFMNYMDYVDDDCMNMFTQGQATRMMAAITNLRPGLLNSQCGMGPGCTVDITVNAPAMGNTLASNSITTQNTVAVNGAAVFSAPNVNLNAGFEVPAGNCFEANNVGCAYNGVLMCDGGGGATGTCASPHVITCGQAFQGNNAGGASNWTSYQGGTYTDLTGPEKYTRW
ncbi:MAG: hypothetical protein IPL46_21965 [Saprospiraceae bacterium]|nr:hypothetical protein [Saprospiraceae bacterium]